MSDKKSKSKAVRALEGELMAAAGEVNLKRIELNQATTRLETLETALRVATAALARVPKKRKAPVVVKVAEGEQKETTAAG